MKSSDTVEALERACVAALLPRFQEAYSKLTAAWAKWWFAPNGSKVPVGGRSYETLHDFIVDAVNRNDDKYGGGAFLSFAEMLNATAELAKNDDVVGLAPNGVPTEHVNPRWFALAAKQFIQQQRFLDKTDTLQGVQVRYISRKGLYLESQPQREYRHH